MPTGVYIRTEYHKKINSDGHKGIKQSPETIEKRRLKMLGHIMSKKVKNAIRKSLLGIKHSELRKKNQSEAIKKAWKEGRHRSTLPVGTITIRRHNKKSLQRKWIKVAEPNEYIKYANFIWLKHKRKLPKGYGLHHKDGNTLNDRINNLEAVSKRKHMELHRKDLYKR